MFLGFDLRHSETWATLGVLIGGGMLFSTLVLEHVFALNPCYLCLSQRYCMFLAVFITTLSLFLEPRRGIFPVLTIVCCLGGIGFAFRQFYLQYVPGAAESCDADLNYYLENNWPHIRDIVSGFFKGSESCGDPSIIPILSCDAFLLLITIAVLQLVYGPRSSYK